MAKILAVIGATGHQGSSIIDFVLHDVELSSEYKIRAITRDVTSAKAKELALKDIDVVQGDVMDHKTLAKALAGTHTLYATTTPFLSADGFDTEYDTGVRIADTAVEQKVQYLIFSSLPNVTKISGGKYKHARHFDAKAKVEEYIRGLSTIQSSFVLPTSFMENFSKLPLMKPQKAADGTYVLSFHLPPESKRAYIDAGSDFGKFVGNILAKPAEYVGRTTLAAVKNYTWKEVADIMFKVTGKTVVYKQLPIVEWKASLLQGADVLESVMSHAAEFGYCGPDTDEMIKIPVEHARGKLTTLEEYFEAHPLELAWE